MGSRVCAGVNGAQRVSRPTIIDTDILIDAALEIDADLDCLTEIEQRDVPVQPTERHSKKEIMTAIEPISNKELAAHRCLEKVDNVSGDPETTAFKRRARLQQALWREARHFPIGTQPMRPGVDEPSRPLGSRIALDWAYESESNFLNEHVRDAVKQRLGNSGNITRHSMLTDYTAIFSPQCQCVSTSSVHYTPTSTRQPVQFITGGRLSRRRVRGAL